MEEPHANLTSLVALAKVQVSATLAGLAVPIYVAFVLLPTLLAGCRLLEPHVWVVATVSALVASAILVLLGKSLQVLTRWRR